jgi:NADH-quinone oxidoreductase subunit F/NADP-reducing hydrogenase subunit HndC
MAVAAYAIGATAAFVYIRAEYPLATGRLATAISQAWSCGLLGHSILDSGFDLDVTIKEAAGAFVCGEETALIRCRKAGVPITNYGLTIAYSLGIFERVLGPFPAALEAYREWRKAR